MSNRHVPAGARKALTEAGRAAWPDVEVRPSVFVRYVADRLEPSRALDVALETLRVGDLYLACACTSGNRVALAHFDREFLAKVPGALGRLDSSPAFVDEVLQLLRQ